MSKGTILYTLPVLPAGPTSWLASYTAHDPVSPKTPHKAFDLLPGPLHNVNFVDRPHPYISSCSNHLETKAFSSSNLSAVRPPGHFIADLFIFPGPVPEDVAPFKLGHGIAPIHVPANDRIPQVMAHLDYRPYQGFASVVRGPAFRQGVDWDFWNRNSGCPPGCSIRSAAPDYDIDRLEESWPAFPARRRPLCGSKEAYAGFLRPQA